MRLHDEKTYGSLTLKITLLQDSLTHVSPDTSYYAGTYLDDTTSYLNTLNNSTPSYMNSPTLSHVTTEPAPFVTDPFSSCAKSGMGSPASYYSKTLGPCTEVIKASMDLI